MKRIQIFKPGRHTSASGVALEFTEADLARSAAVYDPAVHEAPLVVGHPRDNGPAYGWVSGLNFSEGSLEAEPKDVEPQFAELVATRRFPKRSASFYAPGSANHPLAGKDGHDAYYLRHVGFLGAAAPAVKGMREVEFAADDEGVVEFAEDWMTKGTVARLFSGLRDWMLATAGQEKADQVLPKYAIEDLAQAARDAEPKPEAASSPAFNEDTTMTLTPAQIAELQAKAATADKLTADFAELKAAHDALAQAASLANIRAAIEPHVKAGKVLPAEVEQLASFAAGLDDAAASFEFSEGEKTTKVTARAMFLAQLGQRAKVVDFSERAGKDADEDDPGKALAEARQKVRDQVAGRAKAK